MTQQARVDFRHYAGLGVVTVGDLAIPPTLEADNSAPRKGMRCDVGEATLEAAGLDRNGEP